MKVGLFKEYFRRHEYDFGIINISVRGPSLIGSWQGRMEFEDVEKENPDLTAWKRLLWKKAVQNKHSMQLMGFFSFLISGLLHGSFYYEIMFPSLLSLLLLSLLLLLVLSLLL